MPLTWEELLQDEEGGQDEAPLSWEALLRGETLEPVKHPEGTPVMAPLSDEAAAAGTRRAVIEDEGVMGAVRSLPIVSEITSGLSAGFKGAGQQVAQVGGWAGIDGLQQVADELGAERERMRDERAIMAGDDFMGAKLDLGPLGEVSGSDTLAGIAEVLPQILMFRGMGATAQGAGLSGPVSQRLVALLGAGWMGATEAEQEAQRAGLTGEDKARYVIMQGLSEGLITAIMPGGVERIGPWRQMTAKQIGREGFGEVVEENLQGLAATFIDWALLPENENKPIEEAVQEWLSSVGQTSLVAFGAGSGPGTMGRIADATVERSAEHDDDAQFAEAMNQVADQAARESMRPEYGLHDQAPLVVAEPVELEDQAPPAPEADLPLAEPAPVEDQETDSAARRSPPPTVEEASTSEQPRAIGRGEQVEVVHGKYKGQRGTVSMTRPGGKVVVELAGGEVLGSKSGILQQHLRRVLPQGRDEVGDTGLARPAGNEQLATVESGGRLLEMSPERQAQQENLTQLAAGIVQQASRGEEGWQQFGEETGTRAVPRAEMPQIKSEHRGALANYLRSRGIEWTREEAMPGNLRPTQAEYQPAKVQQAREYEGEERAILVSQDGHVVDGHHQWLAKLADAPREPIEVIRLAAPIDQVLPAVVDFPSAQQEGRQREQRTVSQVEKVGHIFEVDDSKVAIKVTSDEAGRSKLSGMQSEADRLVRAMAEAGTDTVRDLDSGTIWRRNSPPSTHEALQGDSGWQEIDRNGNPTGSIVNHDRNLMKPGAAYQPVRLSDRGTAAIGQEPVDSTAYRSREESTPRPIQGNDAEAERRPRRRGVQESHPPVDGIGPDGRGPVPSPRSVGGGTSVSDQKGQDNAEPSWSIKPEEQPQPTAEQRQQLAVLYDRPEQRRQMLRERLEAVTEELPNAHVKMGPIKKQRRVIEKANQDYLGDISRVRDVYRATIVLEDAGQIDAVRERISEQFGEATREKDRFANPTPEGYRDLLLNLPLDGVEVEVKVNLAEMVKAKSVAHPLYERSRAPEVSKAEKEQLVREQLEIYTEAWERVQTRTASSHSSGVARDPSTQARSKSFSRHGLSSPASDTIKGSLEPLGKTKGMSSSTAMKNSAPGKSADETINTSDASSIPDVEGDGKQYSPERTPGEGSTVDGGPVFRQFRHDYQGALAALQEAQAGEAVAALSHPEIGDIDLIWGDEGATKAKGYGLAKLLRWHPEVVDQLDGIVRSLPVQRETDNSVFLDDGVFHATLRTNWKGREKRWLLTAFKRNATDQTMDRDDAGAERTNSLDQRSDESVPDQDGEDNGRLYSPERTPGEEDARQFSPHRPPQSGGIETLFRWAVSFRERTIKQYRKQLRKKDDPGDRAILKSYEDINLEELHDHMLQFPQHYLEAAKQNRDPSRVFLRRHEMPPVQPRIQPAPVKPSSREEVKEARGILSELVNTMQKLHRDAPDILVDRAALPDEAGGSYNPMNQSLVAKYHNDVDLVSHEYGHYIAQKFTLLPKPSDSVELRGELLAMSVHGSRATGDQRLHEGIAEFIRAWMLNPDQAERQAPLFTDRFLDLVPSDVVAALQAYGMRIRTHVGASAEQKMGAAIVGTKRTFDQIRKEDTAAHKAVEALREIWYGREQRGRAGEVRVSWKNPETGKREKINKFHEFLWVDTEAPMLANNMLALELGGKDLEQMKPSERLDYIMSMQRGQAGRIRGAMIEHGLPNADLSTARFRVARIDEETGEIIRGEDEVMTIANLLKPLMDEGGRDGLAELLDKAHNYGSAQRSLELEQRFTEEAEAEIDRFAAQFDDVVGDPFRQRQAEQAIEAFAEERRKRLKQQIARLTPAGMGIEDAGQIARQAVAELAQEPPQVRAAIEQYLDRYRQWASWKLDRAVQGQVLSPRQVASMRNRNWFYIDWHRVFGENDDAPIDLGEEVVGSMRTIHNPLASLLHATESIINRAEKNEMMLTLTSPLRGTGMTTQTGQRSLAQLGEQVSEERAQEAYQKSDGRIDFGSGRSRRVYRLTRLVPEIDEETGDVLLDDDGQPVMRRAIEYWTFDAGTEASLEAGRLNGWNHILLRIIGTLTRFTRMMITTALPFRMRVLARDNIEQLLVSETGLGRPPSYDKKAARAAKLGREELQYWFDLSGANLAGVYHKGRDSAMAEVYTEVNRLQRGGWSVVSPSGFTRMWGKFGEWAENIARKREFHRAWREAHGYGLKGKDAALFANKRSRELLDAARGGLYAKQMNSAALFLNASIQGVERETRLERKMLSAVKNGRWQVAAELARVLGIRYSIYAALTMAGQLALLAGDDDDEAKEEIMAPAWSKDFAFKVDTPFGKMAIAQPYGHGWAIGGSSRRLADYLYAKSKGWDAEASKAFEGWSSSGWHSMMPVDEDVVALGFKPIIEVLLNRSFWTDSSIVPYWEERKELAGREGTERASPVGRAVQAVTQLDARYVDHLLRGFGGGWGGMATARDLPELGKRSGGIYGGFSPYQQRDVSWVLEHAELKGQSGIKPVQALKRYLRRSYRAETEQERRAARMRAYRLARKLREATERNEGQLPTWKW